MRWGTSACGTIAIPTAICCRSRAPELVTEKDIMEYDLDSNPVRDPGRRQYSERYIHGEIYKLRPDVMAVVHAHMASVARFDRPPPYPPPRVARGRVWEVRPRIIPLPVIPAKAGIQDHVHRHPSLAPWFRLSPG